MKTCSRIGGRLPDVPVEFFTPDVWFSLRKLTLIGMATGLDKVHRLLSMLHPQCSCTLDVRWFVNGVISFSDTSLILLDIFRQLKGPQSIELELSFRTSGYYVRALSGPRIIKSLDVFTYFEKNTVRAYAENLFLIL